MKGEENLIPMSERTEDEVRELASKGGKKSGEVRRRKRDAKNAARLILNLTAAEGVRKNLEQMGVDEEDHTNMVAVMARAFQKAMTGDVGAMNFLMEMSAQSPRFKLEEERHKKEMQDEQKSNNAVDDWINSIPDTEG